ncbi:MAG: sensor histidine kinase [Candidatus Omnitrophota bacterium]
MNRYKAGIGLKITIIIVVSMLIFLSVSVGLSYFYLFDSLRDDKMASRGNMAEIIAGAISDAIDSRTEFVKINASAGVLREAVSESNIKYQEMDADAVRRYILDVDNKWLKSSDDHPLIQEYIGNRTSLFLRSGAGQDSGFFNILVADKYGAIAGASYRPRGFYCGDEDWFKAISSGPGGRVLFGDAVFDETSGKWSFTMASAVVNEAGETIGAYKALVDVSAFFKPLEGFRADNSEKAALIDSRGYLIFYPGIKPFSNKFCEYDELRRLLNDTKNYSVINTAYMGKGKTAVAVYPVTNPILQDSNIRLYVIIAGSVGELFSPLNSLALKMAVLSLILVFIVSILAGVSFGSIFTSPARKLIDGIKHIGEGKFDYRADIKTGDEMEDLASALNEMTGNLERIVASVKMLDQEKLACKAGQQRLEKEDKGFFSLMSQVYELISDMAKGIETLRQGVLKPQNEQQKRDLELLRSHADNIIREIEKDIYAYKLETGSLEFKMDQRNLRDIIKESIFDFEPKIISKGLNLNLNMTKTAVSILADKDKIKRVFDILVGNSLAATENGYITISVTQAKGNIECSVSDTGKAIPKELVNEVFDRFSGFSRISSSREGFRTDPSLYIAKRIIDNHGGRIWVESEPGGITSFKFVIPISSHA